MSTKINGHHYYKNPKFQTERLVLEGLVKICSFNKTVGFFDHHDSNGPLEIGIVDNKVKGPYPVFKKNTSIFINLHYLYSEDKDPAFLKEEPSTEAMEKIMEPLEANFVDVLTFLIDTYEDGWGKACCHENLKKLKKEISS